MIPGVPYDAEIEYLESTGMQYIDTGIYVRSTDQINYKVRLPLSGSYTAAFSAYTNEQSPAVRIIRNGNSSTSALFSFGAVAGGGGVSRNVSGVLEGWMKTGQAMCNGLTFSLTTPPAGWTAMTSPLWLLPASTSGARIYYLTISGVCDFIPVRVGQTGYMYDRVTKRLFGNKGTGSFVLGPDVAKPVMGLWGMRKRKFEASDYVQDGLVAMWDGIENAGRGQWGKNNPNATDWPALVGGNTWGTGTNIKYNSEKHYYDTNRVGNSDALKFNLPKAVNLRGSTFEFVVEGNYASADYRFLIGLNSQASDGDFFQIGVSQVRMHYSGSSLYATGSLNTPYTFSASASASGPAKLYRNAVVMQSPNAANHNVTNFRCPANSANHVSGKLWAIRVYNRALSPAEIAHNYQIDKARFNLT